MSGRTAAGTKGRSALGRPDSSDATSLPVYYQLYVVLRESLRDGKFPFGHPLPSETMLAERFKVSRVTVRRAFEMLEQDGWIERRRGIGTFPRSRNGADGQTSGPAPLANLITIGVDTHAEILNWENVTTPPFRVVAALGIAGAPACLMIERLRRHGGDPFSLTTLWIPAPLAGLVARETIDDAPIVEVIERAGRPAATADQTLSAQLAGDRAAQLLGTSIGAPLISLRRIVRDGGGKALLYQHSLYDPERSEYSMALARDDAGPRPHWRHLE